MVMLALKQKENPNTPEAGDPGNNLLASDQFNVALVLRSIQDSTNKAVYALGHMVSTCRLTAVVVLEQEIEPTGTAEQALMDTIQQRHSKGIPIRLLQGSQGYQQMLQDDSIRAIYAIMPSSWHCKYIIPALASGKHALIKDPMSTLLPEFLQQLEVAQQHGRFIQFATMFVHHHRVQRFMEVVLYEKFGHIDEIYAHIDINYNDLGKIGVALPITHDSGCIRVLGRYCVLLAALVFTRTGSWPTSAQVTQYETTSDGQPLSADCVVNFSGDRRLTFHVGYTIANTRQVLEVKAKERYATMADFIIPHPDGLATYRVYDKHAVKETDDLEVVRGQAIDVPSGLTQDVVMWRKFHDLCNSIEGKGWDSPEAADARELTDISLQLKRILLTLEESFKQGCEDVTPSESTEGGKGSCEDTRGTLSESRSYSTMPLVKMPMAKCRPVQSCPCLAEELR